MYLERRALDGVHVCVHPRVSVCMPRTQSACPDVVCCLRERRGDGIVGSSSSASRVVKHACGRKRVRAKEHADGTEQTRLFIRCDGDAAAAAAAAAREPTASDGCVSWPSTLLLASPRVDALLEF